MNTDIQESGIEGIKIKGWHNSLHMSFATHHDSTYTGTLICEGMPLHEKEIMRFSTVRVSKLGNFGKGKSYFQLIEKDAPEFETFQELVDHYHKIID